MQAAEEGLLIQQERLDLVELEAAVPGVRLGLIMQSLAQPIQEVAVVVAVVIAPLRHNLEKQAAPVS
jgi:hypothetical protein